MIGRLAALAAGPRGGAAGEVPLSAYDAAGLQAPRDLLASAAEDRRLADELLAMPAARRLAAAAEARFQRSTLARLLVFDAEAALFQRAGDPRPAAGAAAGIAAALPRKGGGGAREAAARACWLLGKGELRAGRPAVAREAFQVMLGFLDEGAAEDAALVRVGLAQAAEDLNRTEEAAGLWLGATQVCAAIGAAGGGAACQAQLGLLLLARGDGENGESSLRVSLALLDAAFAPSLAARLWLALAAIAAAGGDGGAARRRWERARRLYGLAPGREEAMARAAWEARIAALLGDGARAAALLAGVRRTFLAEGSLEEAAGATLELLLLRIEGERCGAVAGLTGELASAFPGSGEGWAAELDGLALAAMASPRSVHRWVAAVRRRLRRRPEGSRQRPPLLTSSRALCDRLLLGRGEHEDPIGAAAGL